jgi:hypothetical protein
MKARKPWMDTAISADGDYPVFILPLDDVPALVDRTARNLSVSAREWAAMSEYSREECRKDARWVLKKIGIPARYLRPAKQKTKKKV